MEDVLAVYLRPRDPDVPLVCIDEASKQLIADTRQPIQMKPGRLARADYEYERHGTANFFTFFAPLEGWRHLAGDRADAGLTQLLNKLRARGLVLNRAGCNIRPHCQPIADR